MNDWQRYLMTYQKTYSNNTDTDEIYDALKHGMISQDLAKSMLNAKYGAKTCNYADYYGKKNAHNTERSTEMNNRMFRIKKVIFDGPATIIMWEDNTKTVVKCQEGDVYSKEAGMALCFMKKALGNKSNFNNTFDKWIEEEKPTDIPVPSVADAFIQLNKKLRGE